MRIRSAEELPPHLRAQVDSTVARQTHPAPRRPKFGNEVVEQDGLTFDSKWELQRWNELLGMQSACLISDLRHGVPFALHARSPAGQMVRIGCYVADFVYVREGREICEDTKSSATRAHPLFRWKAAHFEVEYCIRIIEVLRVRRRRERRVGA